MKTFIVIVTLCSYAGDKPFDCEKHSGKGEGFLLPHNCMKAGQQIAGRYLRGDMGVKRVRCREEE